MVKYIKNNFNNFYSIFGGSIFGIIGIIIISFGIYIYLYNEKWISNNYIISANQKKIIENDIEIKKKYIQNNEKYLHKQRIIGIVMIIIGSLSLISSCGYLGYVLLYKEWFAQAFINLFLIYF